MKHSSSFKQNIYIQINDRVYDEEMLVGIITQDNVGVRICPGYWGKIVTMSIKEIHELIHAIYEWDFNETDLQYYISLHGPKVDLKTIDPEKHGLEPEIFLKGMLHWGVKYHILEHMFAAENNTGARRLAGYCRNVIQMECLFLYQCAQIAQNYNLQNARDRHRYKKHITQLRRFFNSQDAHDHCVN